MATVDVIGLNGKAAGKAELPDALFNTQTNIPLIHQVVTAQLAAGRQGTHSTKTRAEVSGGGAKPWRQKGTGRARQGSRRAPQWKGGGVVFGPHPRSYAQKTPKKMIAAALLGVLSDRARDGLIFVVDSIVKGETPSTKAATTTLASVGNYANLLVILDRDDYTGWLSLRNLPEVHLLAVDQLNAYDVVTSDAVVFTKAALELFIAGASYSNTVHIIVNDDELEVLDVEGGVTDQAEEAAEKEEEVA
ncbi:MAG: 50S ribosomal protein L4 [Propionibacteriaceae bacterium]|jgi:large subunit ribosomal protein L4|nr:50S ribosomal protein L4 [Propionibacteriaceae bacterium]